MSFNDTARDQKHFRDSWMYHIKQLNTLAFQADVPLEELEEVKSQLSQWVESAASMHYTTQEASS